MTESDAPDLTRCAICGSDAQFTDSDPGANPVSYCSTDLPAHLQTRATAGQMPLQSGATKAELLEQAREFDIEGRSKMTQAQLETAVAAQVATAAAQPELSAPAEVLVHDHQVDDDEAALLVDVEAEDVEQGETDAPKKTRGGKRK